LPKRAIAPLVNGRVRLRLLEQADLPMTLAWRNQDHIRRWFLTSTVIPEERHRAWWQQYRERDDDFVFVIEDTEQFQRPVGQVALYAVDWAAGRAEFGRLMIGDAKAAGLGLAKLATACLVDTALRRWQLNEITLEVRSDNLRAIAIYQACGFTTIGEADGVITMRKGK
jgi:RimJ/RimL family protein N-acetyltransferase